MNKTMYIYKTTNILSGKFYIGKRVYRKRDDDWYLGSGVYLNRAIKKHGRENFKKEILEWCDDKSHLCEREIYWIKHFDSTNPKIGYNLSLGGEGGNVGEEAYVKIGKKLRGRKKPKGFGEKISKALKGKSKSKNHVDNVAKAIRGKKKSKEIVKQMSETTKKLYENGFVNPNKKRVYQYTKNKEFVRFFDSVTEASSHIGCSRESIRNNCLGKSKSSQNYIWSYKKIK